MTYLQSFEGGMAAVEKHNLAMASLAWKLIEELKIPGLTFVSPNPAKHPDLAAPLFAFGLPQNITSGDFESAMWMRNVVVKSTGARVFPEEWGRLGKPGVPPYATRLSFHVFNSEDDVRNMVRAIADILGS